MKHLAALATLLLAAPAMAQEDEPITPDSVVSEAAAEEWIAIDPNDLLLMELAPEADGTPREVVIQLMPPPFSQPWVENIRTLARAHWWDGTSVYRVVDNWVTQWGDVSEKKPLPEGVVSPVARYEAVLAEVPEQTLLVEAFADLLDEKLANAEPGTGFISNQVDVFQTEAPSLFDAYSDFITFRNGWLIANAYDPRGMAWPIHCYASVGVARDLAPDTGTGSELYAVIGHAPRQLDRNIAVVGRVIDGIEHLSPLKRGTGEAGVYETRAEDTPILSVRLASELPDPPRYEYLSTESASFSRYVEVRANRNDAFYTVPAGGVDVCNVQVPTRPVPGE